jgi:RsiW-degrading membrane proteinase PrsW (M82 family)
MDLRREVFPIDNTNLAAMTKDIVFWSCTLLGVVPLFIVTLSDTEAQLTAFALFFAAMWGVIFKLFVLKHEGGWRLPAAAMFFTGLIGMNAYSAMAHCAFPAALMAMPSSPSHTVSLFGFVFQVGVWEEFCKAVPVIAYLLWKRSDADPLTIVLVGVFSGLGFAAFENLAYGNLAVAASYDQATSGGVDGLVSGVQEAMVITMLRSLSLVFCHAVWSGTLAYFVATAFATGRRWGALFLLGLLVAAVLHGVYNWLCGVQITLAALAAGLSFVLFYGYVVKLKAMLAQDAQPSGSSVP